jgi:hypothetical protein
MSRGIIEAQTLRSEQFELEARTSDPSDAQPGEYWIRTDQTNANPDVIAQLRRQDTSGVTAAPIFAASEESNLGSDVVRGPSVVLDDGSVGFVAMTTGDGAVGSPRAVTAAGAEYVSHDALELSPIPDSPLLRNVYDVRSLSGSDGSSINTVSDDQGSDDLSQTTNAEQPILRTNDDVFDQQIAEHDGSDDTLTTTFGSAVSQPFEIFVVGRIRSLGGQQTITDGSSASEGYLLTDDSSYGIYAGDSFQGGGSTDTNAHIWNVRFDESNNDHALIVDGGSPVIGPTGGAGSNSRGGHTVGNTPGDSRHANLDWGHKLFFDGKLSNTKRNEIGNYLASEWGLSWTNV